jgi:hypothetical protein
MRKYKVGDHLQVNRSGGRIVDRKSCRRSEVCVCRFHLEMRLRGFICGRLLRRIVHEAYL